jgi:small subunit ribosomal protein S2
MAKYIFGVRNGIHIFDLNKTAAQVELAVEFLKEVVRQQKRVLFVGTKKQARLVIREAAQRSGEFYVADRWLGGTLTNLQTIRKSVAHYERLEKLEASGEINQLPKKEVAKIRRELSKLRKNLEGIRGMSALPGAMFVVDICRESIAVSEARKLGVPVVAIVDTNADPDLVDYAIAGNDDAIRAITLIVNCIADAIIEAKAELKTATPLAPEGAAETPVTQSVGGQPVAAADAAAASSQPAAPV